MLLSGYSLSTIGVFGTNATGASPAGLVMDNDGNLFGAASVGGANGDGAVFEIAHGSRTITTLGFFNGTNGATPAGALVLDGSGNLFGNLSNPPTSGAGALFEIAHGSRAITNLDPRALPFPTSVLYGWGVTDGSGNQFGTTSGDGDANGDGTVFEIPSGSATPTTLASFDGANGRAPNRQLVLDSSGNLYGTTNGGGANGYGTVFEIANGSGTITSLGSFDQDTNGARPNGRIALDQSGNLYGTTSYGGVNGDGTVFEVVRGSGTMTTLSSFNGANGTYPSAGVIVDRSGNLFGTTTAGGANGTGSVFEIANGTAAINTLASFDATNGSVPLGLLLDRNGNLYGSTAYGGGGLGEFDGPRGDGTVFEIPRGSTTMTTLVDFGGMNWPHPMGLVMDGSGNLYGATAVSNIGSEVGMGAVFEIAHDTGAVTTLAALPSGSTLGGPLVLDSSGNIFLAIRNGNGGPNGVFEIAHGSNTLTPLAFFNLNYYFSGPFDVVVDSGGNVYGLTTGNNGPTDVGTVFEIAHGSHTITTLVAFDHTYGEFPGAGSLVIDSSGNLYATTNLGGDNGNGTVFEIVQGSATITTLASFDATGTNGAGAGGLILDGNGNLYGTTYHGAGNFGTVFELAAGSGTITTLASFNGTNGSNPGGLVLDHNGNIYGTSAGDGDAYGDGTIFELSPTQTDPLLHASATNVNATAGAALNDALVATFTDDDPNGTASQYSASIDWGDGDSTANYQIVTDPSVSGQFDVIASKAHPYAQAGTQTVTVTITDSGGSSDVAHSTANIMPAEQVSLDFNYLVTLARNYAHPGTFATGDLNGDGQVGFDDLVLLARNYGKTVSPSDFSTTANVATWRAASPAFSSTVIAPSNSTRANHRRQHALIGDYVSASGFMKSRKLLGLGL